MTELEAFLELGQAQEDAWYRQEQWDKCEARWAELRRRVEIDRDGLGEVLRGPMGDDVHDARMNAKMEMVWRVLAIMDELEGK
jgi:hypothetical protein